MRAAVAQRWNSKLETIASDLGLTLIQKVKLDGVIYDGWSYRNEALAKCNLEIGFGSDSEWGKKHSFGFSTIDPNKPIIAEGLASAFGKGYRLEEGTQHWPIWSKWNNGRQLDWSEFSDLLFGTVADEVRTLTVHMLGIFESTTACCRLASPIECLDSLWQDQEDDLGQT